MLVLFGSNSDIGIFHNSHNPCLFMYFISLNGNFKCYIDHSHQSSSELYDHSFKIYLNYLTYCISIPQITKSYRMFGMIFRSNHLFKFTQIIKTGIYSNYKKKDVQRDIEWSSKRKIRRFHFSKKIL